MWYSLILQSKQSHCHVTCIFRNHRWNILDFRCVSFRVYAKLRILVHLISHNLRTMHYIVANKSIQLIKLPERRAPPRKRRKQSISRRFESVVEARQYTRWAADRSRNCRQRCCWLMVSLAAAVLPRKVVRSGSWTTPCKRSGRFPQTSLLTHAV